MTVGSCTRSTPTRARSSGGPWTSKGILDGRLLERRADDRRGPGGHLMHLEPFYRVAFTTPEAWNVTREGDSGAEGQSFLIAEGRADGRLSARYRAANFPRRRVDGALEPEFRGALETDDGATILFHWEGWRG